MVCSVKTPLVPVTVTVAKPVAAVALAERVSTVPVVEDVGLKEAVTPLGRPLAANETAPTNAPFGAMVMAEVPLVRWLMVRLEGLAVSV